MHTKGPWKLFIGKHAGVVEVTDNHEIPIVSWMGFDDSRRSNEEHQANARLIAAAPDLFTVVDMLVNDTADMDYVLKAADEAYRKAKEKPCTG